MLAPTLLLLLGFSFVEVRGASTTPPLEVPEAVRKIFECKEKCQKEKSNLECGVNGIWYMNACQRECEGVKQSLEKDVECSPTEKAEFELYRSCYDKCGNMSDTEERVCGEDGSWYQGQCWLDCRNLKATNKAICRKLTQVAECENKCLRQGGYKPICGVDGDYYTNDCVLKCVDVKSGVEGKDCPLRLNLEKYWSCFKQKCQMENKNEVCGKSGAYFYNNCHMECYGDIPGKPGKDCDPK